MQAVNVYGYHFFLFYFNMNICVLLYIIVVSLKKTLYSLPKLYKYISIKQTYAFV